MAKRMMDLNPNSFRKLVATFLEANGRVSYLFCLVFFSRPLARPVARARPAHRLALSPLRTKIPPPKKTQQGYWEADEEKIERLKQMYNEVEDKIEGVE
jgi:magnesium chelatase subunit H